MLDISQAWVPEEWVLYQNQRVLNGLIWNRHWFFTSTMETPYKEIWYNKLLYLVPVKQCPSLYIVYWQLICWFDWSKGIPVKMCFCRFWPTIENYANLRQSQLIFMQLGLAVNESHVFHTSLFKCNYFFKVSPNQLSIFLLNF